MKSSSRIYTGDAQKALETWAPLEFGAEPVPPAPGAQAAQIRAIFQGAEAAGERKAGPHSALRPKASLSDLTTWQPGEISTQSAPVRPVEWIFLDGSEVSVGVREQNPVGDTRSTVRQEQSSREKEAHQILVVARQQADEIILAAQAEADQALMQVQDEIDAQKQEGYRQGWREATSEIEETMKATRLMVDEVRAWQAALMAQGEPILIEMLKEISQKLFGDGAELDTHALQYNLNRIMENAQGLGDLNIFLNPRDAKLLDHSWSEYQMLITGNRVKIIPSGKITRGGCYITGDKGTVDGRVETQLAAVLRTFDEPGEAAE